MPSDGSCHLLGIAIRIALALGVAGSACADPDAQTESIGQATASPTSESANVTELDKIKVDAAENSSLKADQAWSPKYTEPLRDTAQTITVIPAELIQQEGALLLRDVLRQNLPAITFGAGEGGSYGDSINIRGFSATNDIQIDGVRESANTTHTDPFDTQSIEVVQGVSSVYSGAGALGGTINFVTKLPTNQDFTNISLGAGTADYLRGTVDTNQRAGDPDLGIAFRLNAMTHKNQVADRDVTRYSRWGVAPSFTIGMDTPTSLTLSYVHEHDRNLPEYGIPLRNFESVPGVNRSDYYGFGNVDIEKIDSDAVSAIFTHAFGEHASLRNLTRWEQYDRYSITDAVEGRICSAPGQYPLGTNLQAPAATLPCGTAGASPLEGVGGATYTPGGPIGNLRNTQNRIIANQTDVTFHFNTGVIEHSLVVGASVSHEGYSQITGGDYRNADGSTYLLDPEELYAPGHVFEQPLNLTVAAFANSTVDDQAGYVFDTLKFGEHWLFGAGARYEHDKADYSVYTRTPAAGLGIVPGPFVAGAANPLVSDDDLLSYRGSLVYKPVEDGSIYAAFGNSKLPSTASVDGSCSTSCNQAPQIAKTYELGVKWDFLNGQLGFTGAVFRTDRTNYLVASGDPNVPEQQLDGRARVDGVQVGLAGNINRDWSIFANYAHLRSEVLQSVSAHTLATTGIDAQAGNALANTPRDSANLWTTYKILAPLTIGYGVNYTSWVNATAADATPTAVYNTATIPGFVLHNVMGSYSFSKKLNLQLNITNLFDKEYFTQLRTVSTTSGWVNPGAGRTAFLTLNVSF